MIEIIDLLKPKNGGSFKLLEAIDIDVEGYSSLADAVTHFATDVMIEAINVALSGKASQADLDALNSTVSSKANASDVSTATANLQAQIDAIVTPVTEDAEVQNARVGADSTSYNTLKARLDAEETTNLSNNKWSESRISDVDALLYSKNLFDVSTFIPNAERNKDTGEIIVNANYGVSTLIPVISGKTVYFSYNGTAQYAPAFIYVYGKDGLYKSRSSGAASFLIPDNCGYISICILNTKTDKYQAEYGAVSAYTSYANTISIINSNITSLNTTEVNTQAEVSEIKTILYSRNLFNVSTFTEDAERNTTTGEIISNANHYGVSDLIPVISGKTIYSSYNGEAFTTTYMYMFYKNGTYKGFQSSLSSYTVANDVGYISVCILNEKSDKYQVEYDEVTPYTEYGVPISDKVDKIDYLIETGNTRNPLEVIKETPGFVGAFLKVGCIGDSLASGLVTAYKQNDETRYSPQFYEHSWGQYLARATGNTYYNFSTGGLDTHTWLASQFATQCYDGDHNCTAYIIGLGQNDKNHDIPIGTIEDIKSDYTLNPDTYYGNYGQIIQRIKSMFPLTKPKIFVCTDPLEAVEDAGYNAAVRAIANKFANVWLIDLYQYGQEIIKNPMMVAWRRDAHYNAMGYQYCSWIIATYIDWIIRNNPSSFCDVELIDTEYHYHSGEDQ